ncbi:inorganic phosphate transporter, PiT family [Haladaptatus litoreus]|uniref:Phosphate transporter n=1 Tax=Haladaptatus litoreus TaxID=553468 RepID=A0A1N6ZZP8_9EURY|nr:inorganic phosphate transporter [Haladaptatus litoreus]SIR32239.1 inorganic phosphate transporter, PiT family [Haladaptatus litoreus]
MVGVEQIAVLSVGAVASFFMAWTVGAGWTPYAPSVGARTMTIMRAAFFTGLFGIAGAVLQGANVTEAMAAGLIEGVSISPIGAVIALTVAAGLVAIGVFAGYPLATAFTATGAVIGVGLALGGQPAYAKYQQILLLWVLTPFLCGGTAYGLARLIRRDDVPDEYTIPLFGGLVGLILANSPFTMLAPEQGGASVAAVLSEELPLSPLLGLAVVTLLVGLVLGGILLLEVRSSVRRGQRHLLFGIGALVSFSAGGSQVGLAVGPLVPMLTPLELPILVVLVFGGLGVMFGAWMGAPRMIKALARDFSSLGPRRATAALIPAFAIAQTAVLFGIPVSFNEIIVSAVIGSGYAVGGEKTSTGKILYTVFGWVVSLLLSFVLAFGLLTVVEML